jgi:predicted HTH domain antitoxin
MTDIQIPVMVEKEIHALIEAKYYSSISEAVKDAFRSLFAAKPSLKIISAIYLYANNEVSISKASEIAGTNIEEFKEILMSRSVKREIYPDERIDENVRMILE